MSELNAKLRALELEGLIPDRMLRLPIDERGWLVPWFVAWIDGKPDHRVMDGAKLRDAIRRRLCWNCGQPLGARGAFVLGPMCAVNRTNAEPPNHYDCAAFAVRSCPHLSQPKAQRRGDPLAEVPNSLPGAGMPIKRNPGAIGIWITRHWRVYKAPPQHGNKGVLFELGDPERVEWYCQGREATRGEVQHSIDTGLPALQEVAELQDRMEPGAGACAHLRKLVARVETYLPHAEETPA